MNRIGFSPAYAPYVPNRTRFQPQQRYLTQPHKEFEQPVKKQSKFKKILKWGLSALAALGLAYVANKASEKKHVAVEKNTNICPDANVNEAQTPEPQSVSKNSGVHNIGQVDVSEIPEELQVKFEKLKGLEGDAFVNAAYTEMVDYMGLNGIAPKNITKNNEPEGLAPAIGGFNPATNEISYSKGFWTNLTPSQQLNLLAHELKHCEQFANVLSTEGISVEDVSGKFIDSTINQILEHPMNNLSFYTDYTYAESSGMGEEFLQKAKEFSVKQMSDSMRESYKLVLDRPKFKADSLEGQKAHEYLEAIGNYEGLGFLGIGSEAYENNLLEVEAYAWGNKICKLYEKYAA